MRLPYPSTRLTCHACKALLAFAIVFGLSSTPACTKRTDRDTAGQGTTPGAGQDSIRKKPVEAIVMRIDSGLIRNPNPVKIPYPKYAPNDTLNIWMTDPGDARISLFMHQPQHLVWPTMHVHDGDLIRVRYREHRMFQMDSSAAEVIIYLKDDNILYAEERVKVLENREIPGILRTLPFHPSARSEEELRGLYTSYWAEIRELMAANGIFLTEMPASKKRK